MTRVKALSLAVFLLGCLTFTSAAEATDPPKDDAASASTPQPPEPPAPTPPQSKSTGAPSELPQAKTETAATAPEEDALEEEDEPQPQGAVSAKMAARPALPGDWAKKLAEDARARSRAAERERKPAVAQRLLSLATLWSQVADAETKAAALEASASKVEASTLKVLGKTRRSRALVQQAENRRARALARLVLLGLEPPSTTTASVPPSDNPPAPSKAPLPVTK